MLVMIFPLTYSLRTLSSRNNCGREIDRTISIDLALYQPRRVKRPYAMPPLKQELTSIETVKGFLYGEVYGDQAG